MGRPGAGSRVTRVIRDVVEGEESDPRARQVGFAVLLVLDLALRWLLGPDLGVGPLVALVALVVLTAAAFVLPWERLPPTAPCVLAVLDIAVIGVARLSPQGSAAAILVVLPAIWLGRARGGGGALVAGAATLLLVAVPGVAYLGLSGTNLSRSALVPVVATAAAWAVAAGMRRVEASRDLAQEHGRRLAEAMETIAHQRRMAEAILDSVDVGLVLLDRDGCYQTMNRRQLDFLRLAYPEGHHGRAGQPGLVRAADGTRPLEADEMPTVRASRGEEFDDARIWVGGDDPRTARALSVSARSVRGEDGSFAGAALAYTDVTDLMQALAVKDEFVASVSHELRTPLTSIHGYATLLLDRADLPDQAAGQLEAVVRNTRRLHRLVADLLQSAQADEGPMSVLRAETDLVALVQDAAAGARPLAEAGGLELRVETPGSLVARVDAQRIAQVVDNLLTNAVKYTPAGGRVEVCLVDGGDVVELVVRDTGIGIDAAEQQRLFTRFFRGREAGERSIQGVGLGLSITRTIVESHGGRIEVDSAPGRGSAFRVTLPVTS